jgi:hypothetical protein
MRSRLVSNIKDSNKFSEIQPMRIKTSCKVVALVLLILSAGIGFGQVEPTTEPQTDPAELTPEQWAEQFTVEWNHISANVSRNLQQKQTNRSISLSAQVTLVKEENILGLSSTAELSQAVDETDRVLFDIGNKEQAARQHPGHRHYSFPHRMPNQQPWFGKLHPAHMSVSIPNVTGDFPKRLQRVKANLYVLVGKTTPKEIPLEKSDQWTELSPALSVRFKKCDVFNARVEYQLEGQCDDAVRHFHGFINPQHGLPKSFIAKAALLDESGAETEIGGNMAFNPTSSGSAGVRGGAEPIKMRFYVATDVREVAVPFQIENVDVPTLDNK